MSLKVDYEYEESPDETKRVRKIAKILAEGVYSYLKQEGLLRVDPNRTEKVQEALDKARKITGREISGFEVDSA